MTAKETFLSLSLSLCFVDWDSVEDWASDRASALGCLPKQYSSTSAHCLLDMWSENSRPLTLDSDASTCGPLVQTHAHKAPWVNRESEYPREMVSVDGSMSDTAWSLTVKGGDWWSHAYTELHRLRHDTQAEGASVLEKLEQVADLPEVIWNGMPGA